MDVGQPISYYQHPLSSLLQEVEQRHETLLLLFFKAVLLRLCQQGQLAISLTSELCQQIALARIIHNRTSQIIRPLSKVCYKVKSVGLVLGTQWGVFL